MYKESNEILQNEKKVFVEMFVVSVNDFDFVFSKKKALSKRAGAGAPLIFDV